jgi:membrane protein YdbS with pleckstrin-like domain
MATKLYLETTNPNSRLSRPKIILGITVSVIVHTIGYALFFNLVSYIFTGRILSSKVNKRLVIALIVIMYLGFIGRYYRAKDAYRAFNRDPIKTQEYMNSGYVSWTFMS